MKRSGRGGTAQRGAGLFGRADQRIGIVRMLGLFPGFSPGDALERGLHAFQELLHCPPAYIKTVCGMMIGS